MQLNVEKSVLPLLRDPDMARTLVTHPRTKVLMFEGSAFYYLDRVKQKHVRLTGLTKLLKEFYWPAYTPWFKSRLPEAQAIKKVEARRRSLAKKNPDRKKNKKWKTAQELAQSNVRGSIVHRQLADWIKLDAKNFGIRNPDGCHTLTKMALAAFKEKKLVPLAVEYAVACEAKEVLLGTAIDFIGVNIETGRVHFVEVKTSHSHAHFYLDETGIPFKGALAKLHKAHPKPLPHSNCTRARVQLAVSVLMAVEGLGLQGDFDASVLLLSEGSPPDWIPVEATFLINYGVPIYKDLKKRIPQWRAERVEEKKRQQAQDAKRITPDARF